MKYLLDTNIISELITKEPNREVLDFVNCLDENLVFLSVITIGEIEFGISKLEQNSKKQKELSIWLHNNLLKRFKGRIIEIDLEIMLKWGEISANLQKIGKPMPIMDSLIASTVIVKDLILITRNEKDFENLDIELINPFSY